MQDSLVVMFTGDVLLDRNVRPLIENRGVNWLFEIVTPLLKQADASVINLECPLTSVSTPLGKRFIFKADPHWAKDLYEAGVTHAALANNHTNDQGMQGFKSTLESLKAAGITPLGNTRVGEETSPTLIENGHLKLAVFNAVLFPLENWMPQDSSADIPWQTDILKLCNTIKRYKATHSEAHVICVLHWGIEYQSLPTPSQRKQARMLAESGVEAIIGHHPHVIEQMQMVKGIPVAYSLGNFVFDNQRPEACKTQVAELILKTDTLYLKMHDFHLERCRPVQ